MPVFEKKPTATDKLFIGNDGSVSKTAVLLVVLVAVVAFVYLFNWADDKLSARTHEAEKAEIENRSNAERESLLNQMELLNSDIKAKEAEVTWARQREQHHIKERERLENENEELTKLLNSRLPADLLR